VTRSKALILAGPFVAASVSFGAGWLTVFMPLWAERLEWGTWPLVWLFYATFVVWIGLVLVAIRRYGAQGALTLLSGPFAAFFPVAFFLLAWACDWGRNSCI
jgi:hypothetical protein